MSPVPEKFQAYGEAVCAFLSHATRREKAAVRQELMDHLTDHTQALLDAGCPPEAAETRALAAMGEAQEVGQALNRAFPLRWLILSRVLLVLAVLAAIVLLLPIPGRLVSAWNSLAARADPSHLYPPTQDSSVSAYPLDVHFSLPNGDQIALYAVTLTEAWNGTYTAQIYGLGYHQNPFRKHNSNYVTYTLGDSDTSINLASRTSSVRPGVTFWSDSIAPLHPGDTLTAHVSWIQQEISVPVLFPWEEVTNP